MRLISNFHITSPIAGMTPKQRGLYKLAVGGISLLVSIAAFLSSIDFLKDRLIVCFAVACAIGIITLAAFVFFWGRFWRQENMNVTNGREKVISEVLSHLPADMNENAKQWCADRTWYMFSSTVLSQTFGYIPDNVLEKDAEALEGTNDKNENESNYDSTEEISSGKSSNPPVPESDVPDKEQSCEEISTDGYIACIWRSGRGVSALIYAV